MKVLGATIFIYKTNIDKLKQLGYKGNHNQFRVICKCKSMAEGNLKLSKYGLDDNAFKSGRCNVTANEIELSLCEKEDVWICLNGTNGREYISAEELIKNEQ